MKISVSSKLNDSTDSPPLLQATRQLRRTQQHNAKLSLSEWPSLISISTKLRDVLSRLGQLRLVSNDEGNTVR
jgi:hypothetical protein